MRIWILEIGEPLPLEPDVRLHRYGQFSQYLAKQGHQVTWWTSSFSHAPKTHFSEVDNDFDIKGVTLRVIRGLGYSRNISLDRIRHNRHFAKRFSQLATRYERPDIIIAPIPIVEGAMAAIEFAKPRNIPVLTDIRDEWPDELRNLAPKPFRFLAQWMLSKSYKSMSYFCQNVTGIMAVAQKQLDFGLGFARRNRRDADTIFPLGYSTQNILPEKVEKAEKWWQTLNLKPDVLTVCFFGTLGKYFDIETVVRAFRDLKNEIPLQLVVGGIGSNLEIYRKLATDLPNIVFVGWLDSPKIQTVMKYAQIGLAPYKSESAMSMPNKPFEYMSGRLAILSSIQNELADVLRKYQCGITYYSSDVESLKSALRILHLNRAATKQMGVSGYQLWTEHYDTEKIFAKITSHIELVATTAVKMRGALPELPLTELAAQDKQF